jgi:hypothetical protein
VLQLTEDDQEPFLMKLRKRIDRWERNTLNTLLCRTESWRFGSTEIEAHQSHARHYMDHLFTLLETVFSLVSAILHTILDHALDPKAALDSQSLVWRSCENSSRPFQHTL